MRGWLLAGSSRWLTSTLRISPISVRRSFSGPLAWSFCYGEPSARHSRNEESEWRRRLEEEYLRYHSEFRDLKRRIPAAGWRAEYVEEIRALGYETVLGD